MHYYAGMDTKNEEMLTTEQAAEFLKVKPGTLTKWRKRGRGPESVRLGPKTVRYRRSALMAWVDQMNQKEK